MAQQADAIAAEDVERDFVEGPHVDGPPDPFREFSADGQVEHGQLQRPPAGTEDRQIDRHVAEPHDRLVRRAGQSRLADVGQDSFRLHGGPFILARDLAPASYSFSIFLRAAGFTPAVPIARQAPVKDRRDKPGGSSKCHFGSSNAPQRSLHEKARFTRLASGNRQGK